MRADVMRPDVADVKSTDVVGNSFARVDALAKVQGKAQYAGDLSLPRMLYAAVLRSAHPHARIARIDTSRAAGLPGLTAVLTARDVPGRNRFGLIVKDQPVLADDKVRYRGDAVAVVAAETRDLARAALGAIDVEYDVLPAVLDPLDAMQENAELVHQTGNVMMHRRIRKGDVRIGFAEADIVHEATYRTQLVAHCPLEPEAGLAIPTPDGGVEVWASTQNPFYDRAEIAACLGIPEGKVRVKQTVTGGGFGGKLDISVQCHLALLAVRTGRPVRLIYNVEDHIVVSPKRHPMVMTYNMGAKRDGRIVAAEIKIVADTGAYASYGPAVTVRAAIHSAGAYTIPHVLVDSYGVYTNNTPAGAMRGFGVPQVTFGCESHVDTLARKLGLHPVRIRQINALAPGAQTSTGQVLGESVGLWQAIQAVAAASGLWQGQEV